MDQFEKPKDIVVYRPISCGGLGLDHVKLKAQSRLITSFLETASNPKFIHSLYHEALLKYHVLEDRSFSDPGVPPYYPENFFQTIKKMKDPQHLHHVLQRLVQGHVGRQHYHGNF
jgi:hypothetical protein